jgi:hypothetical protein
MPFWLILLLFIATTVIGELLKPKTKSHPGALGDFQFPTAQEGRAIPVVGGTVKITGGNTTWWGDLKIKPIKKRASFLSFTSQLVGYFYYIGVQYVLCWGPVDELIQINADKKRIPYSVTPILNGNGTENYLQLNCTGQNMFGGTAVGGQGGFSGIIDFYRGLQTQQPNDYLTVKQGRIAYTPGTVAYTYSGAGDGTLAFLSGGSSALVETITITANAFITDVTSPFFHKERFTVDGTVSGHIGTAYADNAFSSSRINFTVDTGSIAFSNGDRFTVKTLHATLSPAYKGISQMVLEQCYVGTSNYPKQMEVIIRSCPDPFAQGPSIANINGDCNPALIIYLLMTNADFGLGIVPAKFDAANFQAVAVTLAGEALGVSVLFDSPDTADALIGEILHHIDGVIYTDPATGLWTLKLARFDYDAATLDTLDPSSVVETPDYARGSWGETSNHIILNYLDRSANFNLRSVQAYDAANIAVTRTVRSQTLDFKLFSNRATAQLACTRVLRTFTLPLGKLKVRCNRKMWNKRIGDVFKFTWPSLGIVHMIFRITHIAYGEVSDGKITIDAVEDIFGIAGTAFVIPAASGWVNPVGPATPCTSQRMIELPYLMEQSEGLAAGIYALAMASHDPALPEKSFEIWTNNGTGFFDAGVEAGFCPVGSLNAIYPGGTAAFDSVGFVLGVSGGVDLDSLVPATGSDFANGINLCLIDNEIMAFTTPTLMGDGTYAIAGVARGLLDTVPADHAMGSRVYFFSYGAAVIQQTPYPADLTVTARFTPNSSIDQLPVTSATDVTLTTRSRSARPYPPGNISVNGRAYGVRPATTAGDLTVSWSSRNRLTEGITVQQDAGDVAGETGQFFTVQKKIAGIAVGLPIYVGAAESFTYTAADRGADDPDFTKLTTLEIYSNVGTLASYFPQVVSTLMFGTATTLPSPGRYEFSAAGIGGLFL